MVALTVCQCGGGVLEECGLAHRFQASYGTVLIGRRSAQTDAELIDLPGADVGERTEEQPADKACARGRELIKSRSAKENKDRSMDFLLNPSVNSLFSDFTINKLRFKIRSIN
jgi:hypothetical protein